MHLKRATLLAGGAALLVAGTAVAAERLHRMEVALPDGSVAHIEYAGEVAPKVTVEAADPRAQAASDPFRELDRMAAAMEARQQAMMQQVAAMERAAAEHRPAAPGGSPSSATSRPARTTAITLRPPTPTAAPEPCSTAPTGAAASNPR